MQEELENLKERVAQLEDWKRQKESKQIAFPLDNESLAILNEYFPRIVDEVVLTLVGASNIYTPVLLGKQGSKTFDLGRSYIRYTADPSTDFLTVVDRNPYTKFADDEQVIVYVDFLTGDTEPGGLTAGSTTYHVVSAAADGYSFKLSATQGGAAINITSAGTGKQFILKQ